MARRNREINVFSLSAIDLFASTAGVFIILMMVVTPNYRRTLYDKPPPLVENKEKVDEIKEQLKTVTEQRDAFKEQLKTVTEQRDALKEQLDRTKTEFEATSTRIKTDFEKVSEELAKRKLEPDQMAAIQQEAKKIREENNRIEEELKRVAAEAQTAKHELKAATEQAHIVQQELTTLQSKRVTLEDVEEEKERLKRKLEQVQTENRQIKHQITSTKQPLDLEKKIQDLEQAMMLQRKEKTELEQALQRARERIDQNELRSQKDGSFVAVVMRWSTEKHDIDLTIQDPQRKTFNFKNRSFANHPGEFSLDSRTGPGAELWQSPELIPGKYTIMYNFYNPYGNNKPAMVEGTIFSKEGSISLPTITMDFAKNRRKTLFLLVSEDKKITLQK